MRTQTIRVFLISFIYLYSLFVLANFSTMSPQILDFAAEYGNVAEALASGKGFSNPFGTDSGPTAWVTPLLPLLMAGVFETVGIRTLTAAWVLMTIKYLALGYCSALLYKLASQNYSNTLAILIVPIYLSLLTFYFWVYFLSYNDTWLLLLIGTLILFEYCGLQVKSQQPGILFGILGGIGALCHPVIGCSFVALTILPINSFTWRSKLTMGLISMLVISPWVTRNYIVFDKLIPLKSNVVYEVYQANYLSKNGLLYDELFSKHHPLHHNSRQIFYTEVGEQVFLAREKAALASELKDNLYIYVKKSLYRLVAITVLNTDALKESGSSAITLTLKYVIHLSPLFAITIWLFAFSKEANRKIMISHVTYIVAFLFPFILIGFYFRYRVPLVPAFSMVIFITLAEAYIVMNKRRFKNTIVR